MIALANKLGGTAFTVVPSPKNLGWLRPVSGRAIGCAAGWSRPFSDIRSVEVASPKRPVRRAQNYVRYLLDVLILLGQALRLLAIAMLLARQFRLQGVHLGAFLQQSRCAGVRSRTEEEARVDSKSNSANTTTNTCGLDPAAPPSAFSGRWPWRRCVPAASVPPAVAVELHSPGVQLNIHLW